MQSPADEIIQNSTGTNTVVFLFFSVFSFVFVTPVGANKSFCKNTYKHVEKARKGPEKARNVQRVRFI